ncbi:hypothetical protein, partial [Shewanella sairae]|uniref:hypothetical protein n=1 Tax=Shewanella sairae TaxID=190310 RepID=UPI001C801CB5
DNVEFLINRKMTNKQCTLSTENDGSLVAEIKTKTQKYYLLETNESVTERYQFDEESLVEAATLYEKRLTMSRNMQFSMIENLIALTKKLNYALEHPKSGKWLFTQYRTEENNDDFEGEISIERGSFVPQRFSENLVYLNGILKAKVIFAIGETL